MNIYISTANLKTLVTMYVVMRIEETFLQNFQEIHEDFV